MYFCSLVFSHLVVLFLCPLYSFNFLYLYLYKTLYCWMMTTAQVLTRSYLFIYCTDWECHWHVWWRKLLRCGINRWQTSHWLPLWERCQCQECCGKYNLSHNLYEKDVNVKNVVVSTIYLTTFSVLNTLQQLMVCSYWLTPGLVLDIEFCANFIGLGLSLNSAVM